MEKILGDIRVLVELGDTRLPRGVVLPVSFRDAYERLLFTERPFTQDEQEHLARVFKCFCRRIAQAVLRGWAPRGDGYTSDWDECVALREWVGYYADYFKKDGVGPIPRPHKIRLCQEADQW